ncbi:hypothetical protein C8R47DRAFT_984479, partial [Mycena vitilis]
TVWGIMGTYNVTWDVTDPPPHITNSAVEIFLVDDGMLISRCAKDIDIRLGIYQITVPVVLPGSDYQILVAGDSGNLSPKFTISLL